jgi:DNA-binding HxlR family transcriptional regulator
MRRKIECPIEGAMILLSGRWRALIVYYLDQGPRRFNALQRDLGPISQRMLTRDLRELEAAGVVSRKVYPESPPRVEYALTEQGRRLMTIIDALGDWWEARPVVAAPEERQAALV